ncbi:MAG: allantoinase AllB [Nitrososphaerota archaeon]|nr:allantoinase AllB [Nitrososphaerota archaeon]
MPAFDLVVRNGLVVRASGPFEADVYVSDGKVAAVSRSASASRQAGRAVDARGALVLPGLIDSHVHFRDPGMTQKEDFVTGSRGAAAGGVTAVFDMPTTLPVVTDVARFRQKAAALEGRSFVDYGLYAAAGPGNLGQLGPLASAGAVAFKTYAVAPPPEREGEYEGAFVRDSGELLQVMDAVSKTGLVHCLHAEDNGAVRFLSGKMKGEGRRDPMAHYDSRPNFTEVVSVYEAVAFAEATGARLHVLHMSTGEAVAVVAGAKKRGAAVTGETCPHYLWFTKEALLKFGPYAKYNPPPRTRRDVDALWRGIREGVVDTVVSDHAPHSEEEKKVGFEDILRAPAGTPGVELRLPFMLTNAERRGLSVADVVRTTSTAVARIFGVGGAKGDVKKGLDADLVLVDRKKEWTVKAEELQTKARKMVLFDGLRMKGRVRATILRGETVYEDGVGFTGPGGSMMRGPRARGPS